MKTLIDFELIERDQTGRPSRLANSRRKKRQLHWGEAELATRYDVDIGTIWRWAATGVLPRPISATHGRICWLAVEIEQVDAARSAAGGSHLHFTTDAFGFGEYEPPVSATGLEMSAA
jgi:predicted DNA-binding transcriptional regulator AlpA